MRDKHNMNESQRLLSFQAHQTSCETEEGRRQIRRLWDASLFREFAVERFSDDPEAAEKSLSSSMKYKLRRKEPCPIAEGPELPMPEVMTAPASNNSSVKKVKNARLPRAVHEGLNAWLRKHQDHPFPNKEQKEILSSQLGITPQQVNYPLA